MLAVAVVLLVIQTYFTVEGFICNPQKDAMCCGKQKDETEHRCKRDYLLSCCSIWKLTKDDEDKNVCTRAIKTKCCRKDSKCKHDELNCCKVDRKLTQSSDEGSVECTRDLNLSCCRLDPPRFCRPNYRQDCCTRDGLMKQNKNKPKPQDKRLAEVNYMTQCIPKLIKHVMEKNTEMPVQCCKVPTFMNHQSCKKQKEMTKH